MELTQVRIIAIISHSSQKEQDISSTTALIYVESINSTGNKSQLAEHVHSIVS